MDCVEGVPAASQMGTSVPDRLKTEADGDVSMAPVPAHSHDGTPDGHEPPIGTDPAHSPASAAPTGQSRFKALCNHRLSKLGRVHHVALWHVLQWLSRLSLHTRARQPCTAGFDLAWPCLLLFDKCPIRITIVT